LVPPGVISTNPEKSVVLKSSSQKPVRSDTLAIGTSSRRSILKHQTRPDWRNALEDRHSIPIELANPGIKEQPDAFNVNDGFLRKLKKPKPTARASKNLKGLDASVRIGSKRLGTLRQPLPKRQSRPDWRNALEDKQSI
jgi:hypothetical protein